MASHAKFKPTPYDLTQNAELIRLLRECRGYLHTCRRDHHGTDFQGRNYAMEAIDKICNGEIKVSLAAALSDQVVVPKSEPTTRLLDDMLKAYWGTRPYSPHSKQRHGWSEKERQGMRDVYNVAIASASAPPQPSEDNGPDTNGGER